MEETNKVDPEFLKGFNDGYLIAQHEPELAEKLSKIKAVTPRILGMQQGREQLLKEQIQEKLPNWLKESPAKNVKTTPSMDKNKDRDLERE